MAWYLANRTEVLDQFATGGGLTELRAASDGYPALKTFLDEGMTKNVAMCKLQLEKLASRADSEDVKDTASGLAKLMADQEFVAITQGFGFAPQHDTEKEDASTDVTEAARETQNPAQAKRDKAIAGASRKIQKLMSGRFRSQRKAVLDSHALANLKSHLTAKESQIEVESIRRVTGSVDAPLTDAGRKQAHDLKERVGNIEVFTAPNARSRETGCIVSPGARDAEWLRPWGVGKYEGMSLDAARDSINRLVTETPDQSPGVSRYSGKEGDTFNQVSDRLIGGTVAQRKSMKPGARVLNITSGRALHIIHASALTGFAGIDKTELTGNSEFSKPGDLLFLRPWGLVKLGADRYNLEGGGQYFAQHGETDWNEGVAASEALREADDPDRARLEAEIAAAIGIHIYAQPVTAADVTTFDGAIKTSIDSGATTAADMMGTIAPDAESFIAEYLKDAGFSKLTGDIDKTTVDRLASAVADSYEAGGSFEAVVQAVKDSFADATATRAKMIAQTELNDAWNQSVFHFGKEAGATRKEWITDLAPCPICIENSLDGIIDLDEDFESGDDAPPAHPNCLCSLLVHA